MLVLHVLIGMLGVGLSNAQQFTSSNPEHELQRSKNTIPQDEVTGWFHINEAFGLLDATIIQNFRDGSYDSTCLTAESEYPVTYSADFLTVLASPIIIRGNYEKGFTILNKMTTICGEYFSEVKSEHHLVFTKGATEYTSHRWIGYDHSAIGDVVLGLTTKYIYDDSVDKNDLQALQSISKKLVIKHPGLNLGSCETLFTYEILPGPSSRGENSCFCESTEPSDNLEEFMWSENVLKFLNQPQLLVKKYVFISVLSVLWQLVKHLAIHKLRTRDAKESRKTL